MKKWSVSMVWTMYGNIVVDAETEEEAVAYALGPDCPLPDGIYLDESAEVDNICEVKRRNDL